MKSIKCLLTETTKLIGQLKLDQQNHIFTIISDICRNYCVINFVSYDKPMLSQSHLFLVSPDE